MEAIHDNLYARELFDSGAHKTGESIHHDAANTLRPSFGLEGQTCSRTISEQPRTISKNREKTLQSRMSIDPKIKVTILVPVSAETPHALIHADDTHTCESCRIIYLLARPPTPDCNVSDLQGRPLAIEDACHRQIMKDRTCQHPGHSNARNLRARFDRLIHTFTPHLDTLLALLAAYPHAQHSKAQPVELVQQAPNRLVPHLSQAQQRRDRQPTPSIQQTTLSDPTVRTTPAYPIQSHTILAHDTLGSRRSQNA